MELAEGRSTRARRANAGNHLQELLEQGLDEAEEALLRAHSEDTSDTSYTCDSDEEAFDVIDSDFSDEEVEGTLEGSAVETEADVWREERAERRRARAQLVQRSERLSRALAKAARSKRQRKSEDDKEEKRRKKEGHKEGGSVHARTGKDSQSSTSANDETASEARSGSESREAEADLRSLVRHRPPPTIPLQTRLQDALARARHLRQLEQQQQQQEQEQREGEELQSPLGPDEANGAAGSSRYAMAELTTTSNRNIGADAAARQSRLVARRRRQRQKEAEALRAQQAAQNNNNKSGGASKDDDDEAAVLLPEYWRVRLYEGDVPQRVMYCSGRRSLAECGVATVVAFSHALPPVFGGT